MHTTITLVEYAQSVLQAGANHTQWAIRFAAAEALAALGDASRMEDLQQGAASPDSFIRQRAIVSLDKLQAPALHDLFARATRDESSAVSAAALEALAGIGDKACLSFIKTGLQDGDSSIQLAAVRSLGILGKVGTPLLKAIATGQKYDCNYVIRLKAIAELVRLGNPAGKRELLELLQAHDLWIAFLAAQQLALLGDHQGVPQLKEMLRLGQWAEKIAALESLLQLGIQQNLADTIYRDRDASQPDEIVQVEAIRVLDRLMPETTAARLQQMWQSQDEEVKFKVLDVIGELGRPGLIAVTGNLLSKGPEYLRAKLVMVIDHIGDPELLPNLAPVLEKSHWLLRLQAARVTVRLGRMIL